MWYSYCNSIPFVDNVRVHTDFDKWFSVLLKLSQIRRFDRAVAKHSLLEDIFCNYFLLQDNLHLDTR